MAATVNFVTMLWVAQLRNHGLIPRNHRDISPIYSIQTDSGAPLYSCPMYMQRSFPDGYMIRTLRMQGDTLQLPHKSS